MVSNPFRVLLGWTASVLLKIHVDNDNISWSGFLIMVLPGFNIRVVLAS